MNGSKDADVSVLRVTSAYARDRGPVEETLNVEQTLGALQFGGQKYQRGDTSDRNQ